MVATAGPDPCDSRRQPGGPRGSRDENALSGQARGDSREYCGKVGALGTESKDHGLMPRGLFG